MWSKAPPKPAKAQPAADAKSASHPSGAPADAEEALRQAQEVGTPSCFLPNHLAEPCLSRVKIGTKRFGLLCRFEALISLVPTLMQCKSLVNLREGLVGPCCY